MPRERSKASLRLRSRAGRRLGTLAKLQTNCGTAHRTGRPRKKVGATQSNQRATCSIDDGTGRSCWLDRVEKRIDPAANNDWHSRSAISKFKRAERKRG